MSPTHMNSLENAAAKIREGGGSVISDYVFEKAGPPLVGTLAAVFELRAAGVDFNRTRLRTY